MHHVNALLVSRSKLVVELKAQVGGVLMHRNDIDTFMAVLIATHELCDTMGEEMSIPIIVKEQFRRCNLQTINLEEYIRIAVFLPFLDHFIN